MRSALLMPASRPSLKQIIIASAVIFLVAFGVRLLSWHDTRMEVWKVQTVVAGDYQRTARLLRQGGLKGFLSSSGPLADPNLLGHPPGYPIAQAVLGALFGESTTVVQFFQITCDALAAVLILLIAIELLPLTVGVIAGLLVAFSSQFVWNSVLLLPDTLAVPPLLLAVYCLARALRKPRIVTVIAAGGLIGLSCWLRANALLMAPFFAVLVLFLFDRVRRWRYAGALLTGALLTIAPLTIRNWIVFHHFIPVSLGAGQTMLEGISDYDPERRFGIPNTDMGIMKMEAEQYNRPAYYSTLFAPDGIKRERMRLERGFGVIRDNPGWFVGVMIRRAVSMLRLERARLISTGPPVTYQFTGNESQRVWIATPRLLSAPSVDTFPGAEYEVSPDGQLLQIASNKAKYGLQLRTAPIPITKDHDHLVRLPILIAEGRMAINVIGTRSGNLLASGIVEKAEVKEGQPQPTTVVTVPFVSGNVEFVCLVFSNAAPEGERSVIQVGTIELFDLGPASFLWTRYPRLLINSIQRLFITAVMLSLAFTGTFILLRRRAVKTVVLLLGVPAYYLCFQSLLHTEYRYVLAIHYFLFVLVAVTVYEIWSTVIRYIRKRRATAVNASEEALEAR